MKHSITYKITAVVLALLVLFSSLSYSIEKHFCEGEMSSSIFKKGAELCALQSSDCHKDESEITCCNVAIEASNCCMDSSEYIKGIDIEERARTEQRIHLQPIVVLFSSFFVKDQTENNRSFSIIHRTPPLLLSIDIGVLFQVFRI